MTKVSFTKTFYDPDPRIDRIDPQDFSLAICCIYYMLAMHSSALEYSASCTSPTAIGYAHELLHISDDLMTSSVCCWSPDSHDAQLTLFFFSFDLDDVII